MNPEDEEYDDFFEDDPSEEEIGLAPAGTKSAMPSVEQMIDTNAQETSEVPSDYTQHLLLSYLVSNPSLWIKCAPIMEVDYFDQQYKPVVRAIEKHLKQYQDMPTTDMLQMMTGVKLDNVVGGDKESVQAWVCDSVEEFCRTTAFEAFLVESADVIAVDRDRNTLAGMLKEAQSIASISLHRNLGHEVHDDARDILERSKEDDSVSTGSQYLDRAMSGGPTRPSFNIVSAASGDGKSIFMQNMCVNAIEQGMNAIFYTLELATPIVVKRFAAMMTDTHIDSVYSHMDTVTHTLRTRRKTEGQIWVVKMPMSGTTMADIASHYLELQMETGLDFGMVAIDYIDVMTPVEKVDRANIHLKDKFVSEEMNDWAHQNKLILWSASQQTKGSQDEHKATQSSVAGGTPKISTCDNLIIGKRSEEDKEDERWWAHFAKARSSGATNAKVPLHWNAHTQRMVDGDLEDFKEANPFLFSSKVDKIIGTTKKKKADEPDSEKATSTGKVEKAKDVRDRLYRGLKAGKE